VPSAKCLLDMRSINMVTEFGTAVYRFAGKSFTSLFNFFIPQPKCCHIQVTEIAQ